MTAVDTRPAPAPGTPEWVRLMSASKVPVALGLSPWQSPFSLWHDMTGRTVRDVEQTPAMARGHFLEAGVLAWWQAQHPEVRTSDAQVAVWLDDWGIATLDTLAILDDGSTVICEAKTSSSWDEWGTPGTDEVPVHYLAQVLWQLALTPQAVRAYIAVLGPFLDFREYVIERADYAEDIDATVRAARAFYDSLAGDTPPEPSAPWPPTIATLRALHPDIERGRTVVVPDEVAAEYVAADIAAKDAATRKEAAQAAVLAAAGRSQYVETAAGLRVARRQPGARGAVTLRRTTHTIPNRGDHSHD